MTWTFYLLLMACLLIPTIIVGISDSIEKEERPAKARRSTKERRKANNTFRGEYTTRGRNNANTY
jgi:hypothetical protein